MTESQRQTGVVKNFDDRRKYGFILPDAGGPDVFVHISSLQSAGIVTLHPGQRVEFVAAPDRRGGKGPRAVLVAAL